MIHKFWPTPTMDNEAAQSTDRELWREREGDYYSDSIHVTKDGGIGINCGGTVIVAPLRSWFAGLKAVNQADIYHGIEMSCSVLCSLAMLHLEGRLWDYETTFCGFLPTDPIDGYSVLSIPFSDTPDIMLNVAKAAKALAELIEQDGYKRFYQPPDLLISGQFPWSRLISTRQGLAIRIHKEHGLYSLSVTCAQ